MLDFTEMSAQMRGKPELHDRVEMLENLVIELLAIRSYEKGAGAPGAIEWEELSGEHQSEYRDGVRAEFVQAQNDRVQLREQQAKERIGKGFLGVVQELDKVKEADDVTDRTPRS